MHALRPITLTSIPLDRWTATANARVNLRKGRPFPTRYATGTVAAGARGD